MRRVPKPKKEVENIRSKRENESNPRKYHECSYLNCPDQGLPHKEVWRRELEKRQKELDDNNSTANG